MKNGPLLSHLTALEGEAEIIVEAESGIRGTVHSIHLDKTTNQITLRVRGLNNEAMTLEMAAEGQEYHKKMRRRGQDADEVKKRVIYGDKSYG